MTELSENTVMTHSLGYKSYEGSNHLGNVLVTFSDRKIYDALSLKLVADVKTATDYYPFGSQMPERTYSISGTGHKFGFNGMESDNEIYGDKNAYDFGARMYDSRIGKFLSVDSYNSEFPFLSPYCYARNNPIMFIDVDGNYAGETTRSLSSFIDVLNKWSTEALKNKKVSYMYNSYSVQKIEEANNKALVRIFNHDITSATKDQIVKDVKGVKGKGLEGQFSYYKNFGNDKRGAFVDVGGFPLDIKHFMKNVEIGNTYGEMIGNKISLNEEFWQGMDPKATKNALTSSFSPEDLVSNSLGLIFSRYDDNGNFVADLQGMLTEVATLFETNKLEGGQYLTDADESSLRTMIKEYQGTDDFRDLKKGSAVYKAENMKANREKNMKKLSDTQKTIIKNTNGKASEYK